jgi:Tyrosine phosphatase family
MNMSSGSRQCCILNFRCVAGFDGRIYRCASTDALGTFLIDAETPEEAIVRHQAGLILDLRSPSERKEDLASTWMAAVGVTVMDAIPGQPVPLSTLPRRVLRIDVLSPVRFFAYTKENWLSPSDRAFAGVYRLLDPNRLHSLQIDALNARGLSGLNEAILETGKAELCLALKEMTLHLEQYLSPIVFHCVQGKDRTGLLAMLCQSILLISEKDIIEDYFKSDIMRKDDTSAAAERMKESRGTLDKRVLSGAPREAMIKTLAFVGHKYGSVVPGYLDAIEFDKQWRQRFQAAVGTTSKL